MKKKTFAILFYVKRTKLLKNGEAPIFMRITVDALRAEMSIQRSINLSDWIEKKCCAKPTNAKNRELNHYLEHIRYKLYEIQKELEDENKTVTAELLKNRYLGFIVCFAYQLKIINNIRYFDQYIVKFTVENRS